MATLEIRVPQMGEGLQEVILHKFLKQPGDRVKRDEILYLMETDKAEMEVESAYDGVLQEWLCAEGEVVPIGGTVALMQIDEALPETVVAPVAPVVETEVRPPLDLVIPPRTRAYCKEKGISDDEMRQIPAVSNKLLPTDVDAYLETKATPAARIVEEDSSADYKEILLTQQQRTFNYRIKRSAQLVIPATAKRSMEWGSVRRAAESLRATNPDCQPSTFQIFAYCVAQAIKEHPKFRSVMFGETAIRQYDHVNLGIAVGLPEGELVIAVVPEADTLSFRDFVAEAQTRIQQARGGDDQASETTQFLLTYMGAYELTDAIPVLVAPAVGILFIGSAFEQGGELVANLSLTFDHRLIQGIEAAEFLRAIVQKTRETLSSLVQP